MITLLVFDLAYFEETIQLFNHYAMGTLIITFMMKVINSETLNYN